MNDVSSKDEDCRGRCLLQRKAPHEKVFIREQNQIPGAGQ